MAFVTRTLSAFVLSSAATLALFAPQAAEARNGQNAALFAGAFLGMTAGAAMAQSMPVVDRYPDAEPAPPRFHRQRDDGPGFDGSDDGERGFYGERGRPASDEFDPRVRTVDDAWPRRDWPRHDWRRHDWRRGYDERPCPDRDWRHDSEE